MSEMSKTKQVEIEMNTKHTILSNSALKEKEIKTKQKKDKVNINKKCIKT
jgi:hypothetical protein